MRRGAKKEDLIRESPWLQKQIRLLNPSPLFLSSSFLALSSPFFFGPLKISKPYSEKIFKAPTIKIIGKNAQPKGIKNGDNGFPKP